MLVIAVLHVWGQIEKPEKENILLNFEVSFFKFHNKQKYNMYHFVIIRFDTSDVMRSSTVQGSHQEY